jgi:hypothetical protein
MAVEKITCVICGAQEENDPADCEWEPYFYDGEEYHSPACPECRGEYLEMNEEYGEPQVKAEWAGRVEYKRQG